MITCLTSCRGGRIVVRQPPSRWIQSQVQTLAFSTRARQNRDEVGLQQTFDSNNWRTYARAGPKSIHEQQQHQQALIENREVTQQIKRAAFARDWETAWSLFEPVETRDALLYNAVFHAADKCNRFHDAMRLYEDMRASDMQLSAVTFSPLIRLVARFRRFDQAEALVADMRKLGIEQNPHTFAARMDVCKFARDPEGVTKVWDEMKEAGLPMNETILCTLMGGVAQSGDIARTEAFMAEAPETVQINSAHFNCLLLACKFAGNVDECRRVIGDLRRKGLKPDVISYTSLLATLRATGQAVVEMDSVLQQMAEDGVAQDGFFLEERLSCYLCIPKGMDLRSGVRLEEVPPEMIEKAKQAIQDARASGIRLTVCSDEFDAMLASPTSRPSQAPTTLPAGWEQAQDTASGKAYYFNRSTGETRWDPPVVTASPVVPVAPAAPPPPTSQPLLLPGWEQATDPASQRPYYFNRATGETRWDRPS